jgi:ABC-type branched-subunit amino acid transport system substrate-binding protein
LRYVTTLLLAAAGLAAGCGAAPDAGETVKLGLLLPFTGRSGGPTHNHERAALLARAHANQVGIGGKRLEIVFADTHSDLARGVAACRTLLDQNVAAIIAADSGELAEAILPLLRARSVLLLSPGISVSPAGAEMDLPWFRLAPSTKAMAEALARRLAGLGVLDVLVLETEDGYNRTFGLSFRERYQQLGGRSTVRTLPDDRRSYSSILPELTGHKHVLLAARPETAARLVNEMWSFGELPRWYLPPSLRTDVFVRNASPPAVAGAIGVSPNVSIDPAFADLFSRYWDGDVVLESALFYYDAVALFALGRARAGFTHGEEVTAAALADGLFGAAFNRGIVTTWEELPAALADTRVGVVRYYRGLTGSIVLTPDGQRGFGQEKLWTIEPSGEIQDLP